MVVQLVCLRPEQVRGALSCSCFFVYFPYRGGAVLPETSAISSVILVNRLPFDDPSARADHTLQR